MTKCKKCGAKWRTNYPFGTKSKGFTTFSKSHEKDCRYNKTNSRG